MVFAAELAHRAGLIDAALRDRHREVLTRVGLPTTYAGACFDDLLVTMGRDKKTRGSMLRFVVLQDLAQPTRLAGPDEALAELRLAAAEEPEVSVRVRPGNRTGPRPLALSPAPRGWRVRPNCCGFGPSRCPPSWHKMIEPGRAFPATVATAVCTGSPR